mgnify:CR=1 FL=1
MARIGQTKTKSKGTVEKVRSKKIMKAKKTPRKVIRVEGPYFCRGSVVLKRANKILAGLGMPQRFTHKSAQLLATFISALVPLHTGKAKQLMDCNDVVTLTSNHVMNASKIVKRQSRFYYTDANGNDI